jgi:hypothetical protein
MSVEFHVNYAAAFDYVRVDGSTVHLEIPYLAPKDEEDD